LSLVSALIDIIILGSVGFFFIGAYATFPYFPIFVPALLAEPLALICVFLPWLSATYAHDAFVDTLRANIEIVEHVMSEYRSCRT
jgi:hypothetical protein